MAATYTVKQVAQILGYSTNSIYTFLKEKRIKGIRVGRGRFRVPQAELDRLLMTKKTIATGAVQPSAEVTDLAASLAPFLVTTPQVAPEGVREPAHTGVLVEQLAVPKVDVPSLFDWFTGLASVILGLTMFLFSRMFEEFAIDEYLVWIPTIRVVLLAGGFGLLLTDVVGRKFSVWHKLFHIALLFAYGGLAYILWQTTDLEGAVIYGLLALTLAVTFVANIGGIASFSLYVVSFLAIIPAASLGSGDRPTMLRMLSLLSIPQHVTAYLWMIGTLLFAGLLYAGYTRNRKIFWAGMMGASVILIALSLYYANQIYWGRSLFILLVGLLALIMPIWDSFIFAHKRDRSLIFSVFGTILVLFLVVIGILRILQTNILQYATNELNNKVIYGKTYVESSVEAAKTALAALSESPLLIDAVEKEEQASLIALARGLFESNKSIRKLIIADSAGDVSTIYPHGSAEQANIAIKEYFVAATSTKRPYISDIYEMQIDNTTRNVIVIAAPIISETKKVIGVIVGTLDLEAMGDKLQTIASELNGEYFIVIDRAAKRVIHPETDLIGLEIDEWDDIRLALEGKSGKGEEYNTGGVRTILAYTSIDSPRWGIAIKAPITNLLRVTNAAAIAIFGLVILSILVIGFFMLGKKVKTRVPDGEPSLSERTSALMNKLATQTKVPKKKSKRPRDDTS